MTTRQLAPALILVLALPAELAFAQRSHGGRGGGHRGGGSAVPRGSSMGGRPSAPRMWSGGSGGSNVRAGAVSGPRGGSVAELRHPRAGTGRGGYGGSYWHGGGHHRGYYKPYYGYRPYYGGYYRPYFSGSIYWGWPYYSSAWPYYSTWPYYYSWPSYAGGYYAEGYYEGAQRSSRGAYPPDDYADDAAPAPYSYDDRSREPAPPRGGRAPAIAQLGESGQLRLEVRPEDTSVYVDDQFRGTAADARLLTLSPGRHAIELVRPGYGIERREVDVVKGERSDLLVELRRP